MTVIIGITRKTEMIRVSGMTRMTRMTMMTGHGSLG